MEQIADISEWTLANQSEREVPNEADASRRDGVLAAEMKIQHGGVFGWESPVFNPDQGAYYRFDFRAHASVSGHWEAQFYRAGRPDDFHTSGIPRTDGKWAEMRFYFRAKYGKKRARILLWPGGIGEIQFSDPSLVRASDDDAWQWFRKFVKKAPPLNYRDEKPGELLPNTVEALRQAEEADPVNIALFGDSLSFDVGNTPLDLALERLYPGSEVRIHTCGLGGSGWARLAVDQVLEERLLTVDPDLVILFSVSNGVEELAPNLEHIVDAVRDGCNAESLLVTNHRLTNRRTKEKWGTRLDDTAEQTQLVGREKGCEVADLRQMLAEYLAANKAPTDELKWFLRDETHFNETGRAVVMQLLLQHLAPDRWQDVGNV